MSDKDYRFNGGGGGRGLAQKGDQTLWICVVAAVVIMCGMFVLGPNKHRTHSAGDYGVPTFANGGSYKDGTRQATFNKASNMAYGGHGSKGLTNGFILAIVVCICWLAACWFLPKPEDECDGACCPIRGGGGC
nr:TGB2 [Wheat stripe mosaic virus]AYD38112.1 TGB2 [Wheat stripe mosaic virus]AYD38124.1 TGB2 [Wheat stripe mosaic virus]AYD38130.1 TGB2 [Wheat stripe mosaic virus]WMV61293.1 TGB2 [Wheat stripe mosaic virus]